MLFRRNKQKKDNLRETIPLPMGGDPYEQEYETVQIRAKVVDQRCAVSLVGIKQPKTVKEFQIVFETDEGECLKLMVPEEMYDGFEVGQRGVLTLVDGMLYGFELG